MAYTSINVLLHFSHVVCLWFFLGITVFLVLQLMWMKAYFIWKPPHPKYFCFHFAVDSTSQLWLICLNSWNSSSSESLLLSFGSWLIYYYKNVKGSQCYRLVRCKNTCWLYMFGYWCQNRQDSKSTHWKLTPANKLVITFHPRKMKDERFFGSSQILQVSCWKHA